MLILVTRETLKACYFCASFNPTFVRVVVLYSSIVVVIVFIIVFVDTIININKKNFPLFVWKIKIWKFECELVKTAVN